MGFRKLEFKEIVMKILGSNERKTLLKGSSLAITLDKGMTD